MAGFLLSAAMSTHGVDRALASRFLRPFAGSPRRLAYGLLGMSAFLGMWMSNTATAAMMLSLLNPLIEGRPRGVPLAQRLILAVAFGANIGGLGTPIGTPPNAIAFGALNAAGYHVTFLSWMLVAVPLAALLLIVCGLLMDRLLPAGSEDEIRIAIPAAGRTLSREGRATLTVLVVAMGLWITSGLQNRVGDDAARGWPRVGGVRGDRARGLSIRAAAHFLITAPSCLVFRSPAGPSLRIRRPPPATQATSPAPTHSGWQQ